MFNLIKMEIDLNDESKLTIYGMDIPDPPISTFEDLKLNSLVLQGIYSYGWSNPSQIQRYAIPAICSRKDVLIQAQSGMGKTGSFAISVLNNLVLEESSIQAIIILHTRELAQQQFEIISALSEKLKINVKLHTAKIEDEKHIKSRLLYKDRPTIWIGTPGTLSFMVQREYHNGQQLNVRMIVIDEFDNLMKDNFIDTLNNIYKHVLMKNTQIITVSATLNDEIIQFIENKLFRKDYIKILLKNNDVMLDGINHYYVMITNDMLNDRSEGGRKRREDQIKYDIFLDINEKLIVGQSIIFFNRKTECDKLYNKLKNEQYPVEYIHGNLSLKDRDAIMEKFRRGAIKTLLTTSILSRGIDINTISLVINYEFPKDINDYVHRIGRTGRYGKKGLAVSLITENEYNLVQNIEKKYNIKIPELPDNLQDYL